MALKRFPGNPSITIDALLYKLSDDEHDLGAGRQVGRALVQIVHHRERWAAILVWGPAAMKLIDRDEWIGWTQRLRAERLGLIVQNRRFLVLAETRMPNLALSEHESGAPVAITIASKEPKSEASKTEGEITAAKRLYQKVDLRNAVV